MKMRGQLRDDSHFILQIKVSYRSAELDAKTLALRAEINKHLKAVRNLYLQSSGSFEAKRLVVKNERIKRKFVGPYFFMSP